MGRMISSMASFHDIKTANFVHRVDSPGDDVDTCGFPFCDWSKIVTNDSTGEEVRYCEKLNMYVDTYDSCDFHCHKKWDALMGDLVDAFTEQPKQNSVQGNQRTQKTHRSTILVLLVLVLLFILAIIIMNNYKG